VNKSDIVINKAIKVLNNWNKNAKKYLRKEL